MSASGGLELTAVRWPALRTLWIAQIETDAERTWVRTLLPTSIDGGNLFSLDSKLAVRQLPVAVRLEQIVAGEGQLWGLPDEGENLLLIKESTGEVRSRRLLRPACGVLADPSGVVSLGQLWLSCSDVITAYKPEGGPGKVVRSPKSFHLLASTGGVWALVPGRLVGIAGDAAGRRIVLRDAGEPRLWQAQGDEAWALDLRSGNKALIRVNLATGAIRRFPLATRNQQIDSFAVGPNDIWVALTDKPLILRFDRAEPRRPSAQIDLSKAARSSEFQIFLTPDPSYLWVALFSNRHFKLFRITAPK